MSKDKILFLENEILRHKNLYYQGKPEISDVEYDKIEDELRKLNPNSEALQFVGSEVFIGEKVEHQRKMLSLNKTYKEEDLIKWADNKNVLSTFKIDGSSCSLVYSQGKLQIAKTRGDGRFGEKITSKVIHIPHVPKLIKEKKEFEVRGEVYCTEENFIHLSDEMVKRGLEKPTSQRNIVAGLLGRKENLDLCKHLSFQAFEMFSEEIELNTEVDKFKKLIELGFETPDYYLNNNEKDFRERLKEAQDFMSEGNYLIDGIVFSYNDLGLHRTLGETAHHPRYKIAFKFQGDVKTTKIKSISWQVSRNGILTPVGNVDPVELSGAKVSRVTLHNFGMVRQFELKAGDIIKIVRSGEVIPKFLDVVESSMGDFTYPDRCPSCEKKIIVDDIRLLCKNDKCPDKVKDEILNFVKKIGIDDLSSKRIEEFIKNGVFHDIPSLYDIKKEDLLKLDKVKDKLANKIVSNIQNSKETDIITFLSSLGISGGAYNKCEKVVNAGYDTIEKILNLTPNQLQEIESFAEKSSNEFIKSVQSKKKMIKEIISKGFSFKEVKLSTSDSLSGKKFCITGTLSMKRSELQKIIKENGGQAVSSVSSNTDYLITNDTESSSSKFKKAKELSIPIISETKFLEMVG
jgi:DNA ligase (NAD+)